MQSSTASGDEDTRTPGGLLAEDISNLTPVPPPVLSARFCRHLENELQQTLLSISGYSSPEDADGLDEEQRLERALQLPDRIRERQQALTQEEASLQECRARVLHLVECINEVDPVLRSKLVNGIAALPQHIRSTRVAEADVIAATIEAALLKLSLVRARAYRVLYGHTVPNRPDATVARAVSVAHEKLKERQRVQEAEMNELDKQIKEYESMLSLVDGRNGSFAQVVKDMARVKKETEECRKELRWLGWTGD